MNGRRFVVTRIGNGSISDAHTGVTPEIRPPRGKPPEPSKRLPIVSCSCIGKFDLLHEIGILYFFPAALHKNILRGDA